MSKQFATLAALAPVIAAAAPPVLIGVAIVAFVALLSKEEKKAEPEVDAAPEGPDTSDPDEVLFADDGETELQSEGDAEIEPEEAAPIPPPPRPVPARARSHTPPRRRITGKELEEVFQSGGGSLTRGEAARLLTAEPYRFALSSAYDALRTGGRFSAHLAEGSDGRLTWDG